jgi:hypothetical protein
MTRRHGGDVLQYRGSRLRGSAMGRQAAGAILAGIRSVFRPESGRFFSVGAVGGRQRVPPERSVMSGGTGALPRLSFVGSPRTIARPP